MAATATYIDELKLIASATGFDKSNRALAAIGAAGVAVAGVGLKVGADWAAATKEIVDGYRRHWPGARAAPVRFPGVSRGTVRRAATAIADLNTHLGLTGPELSRGRRRADAEGRDQHQHTFGSVAEAD